MRLRDQWTNLCLSWIVLLVTTALAAFGLGMLFAQLRFELGDFVESLHPASVAAILIGLCFYAHWLSAVVKQTLRVSTGGEQDETA